MIPRHHRMGWAALVLLLTSSCGDPEVQLQFRLTDPELALSVERVIVEVYRPGEPAFDCDDLAFDLVRPVPIIRIELEADTTPNLANAPRAGTKLFLLRGQTIAGGDLVVGCAAVETIEASTVVEVKAEPVSVVSVEGGSFGLTVDRNVDFNQWAVEVQDRLDRRRDEIGVRWEAFGSGMQAPLVGETLMEMEDESGRLRRLIRLPTPPKAGPLRTTVRSRWGLSESVALSFVPPVEESVTLPGGDRSYVVVTDAERQNHIAIAASSGAETELSLIGLDDGGVRVTTTTLADAWRLGRSSAGAFLMSADQTRTVSAQSNRLLLAPPTTYGNPSGRRPVGLLDVSGCDGTTPLVLVDFTSGERAIYDGAFEAVALDALSALPAPSSGCVPRADGPAARVIFDPSEGLFVLERSRLSSIPRDPRIVDLQFGRVWTGLSGVALTTAVDEDAVTVAIRPFFSDADGLLTEPPQALPGLPVALDVGDLDNNGTLDIVAITRVDPQRHALHVISFGDTNSPVTAGLLLEDVFVDPWLSVVDLDGAPPPEIVIGETGPTPGAEATVLIFRMQ